jgi:hypothetical protein
MIGTVTFSGIILLLRARLVLQSDDGAFEIKNLPERNSEIQKPDSTHGAANPTGSNHCLQSVTTRLARGIKQKLIITPLADAPHSVRPPRLHREKDTNLEAQNNVKDNA